MSESPKYFDIAGAAAYIVSLGLKGVTCYTIRMAVASGKLPHVPIGKKFFVSKQAIDAWLARTERRNR